MQNELMATGKLVTLLTSQNTLQDSIASAFQKEIEANRVLQMAEKQSFRERIKRLRMWVIGEAGVIVVLVLLL